jgi:ATP-binding cassette subfamily F protein 3
VSLLVLENASIAFGGQTIFADVNLRIGAGEKIGLIGPNGTGKSTIMKALMGLQSLDGGALNRARTCRTAYLPQDILDLAGDTLLNSVLNTVPGRGDIEKRLESIEQELQETDDVDVQMKLAGQLADLGERLAHFEVFYSERQAARILDGLGFKQSDFGRPTDELSGGWKMRGALAGLLFQKPDVLFLDEPTNHLDLPSVLWLNEFMRELSSAMMLICHDRDFLNRHIERVVSFEPEGLRQYTGDYDSYLEQREQEEEVLEASLRNRERELRTMERFVTRFKAKATKARQAQSRARRVKRLKAELDADKPIGRARKLSFSFPEVSRTGRDVIQLKNIAKSFGDIHLYEKLHRNVYSDDRIAIVGVNGAGKTTLLRIMAGEMEPTEGDVTYGSNVEIGYYSQHHNELLHAKRTVLDEVRAVSPGASESFIRGVCGAFLFSRDEVDKVIGVLSGGERARVLLARLLVNPGNVLLMDEPTNHLDVAAADALANALDSYTGTLIFVSHNTTFVNRLATKVWDISNSDVVEYPGNLAEYLDHLERREETEAEPAKSSHKPPPPKKAAAVSETPPADPADGADPESYEERKARKKQEAQERNRKNTNTKAIRQTIGKLERRIAELEAENTTLEEDLADPTIYERYAQYEKILANYQSNQKKLEELYARWEHQQEALNSNK